MSVIVEIENTANLERARALLGAQSDGETLELALEKVIEVCEPIKSVNSNEDLPDEYWEALFSQPMLPSSVVKEAFDKEREDRF